MKVYIAEKPDIAVKIASVIGGVILENGEELQFKHVNDKNYDRMIMNARSKGYLESNKGCVITYAVGHLYELKMPKDYKPDLKWIPEHFPILPNEMVNVMVKKMYKAKESVKKQTNVIMSLFKKASVIVNCMDADREGQCIFMIPYIMSDSKASTMRMWISDQTEEKFKLSLNTLKPNSDYDSLWFAGISRSIADWFVGMNITGVHVSVTKNMVHIGRVKSPTLAIIVERDLEIDNFIKEKFYTVISKYTVGINGELNLEPLGINKIKSKSDAESIIIDLKGVLQGQVLEYDSKVENKLAPQLYNLASLSADAGSMFHFTMDKTLSIAQKLYDKGFTSYPRTDSVYLPSTLSQELETIHRNLSLVNGYDAFLKSGFKTPSDRYINDAKQAGSSHYAIIPTSTKPDFKIMNDDEIKLYDLIARRFICMFQASASYNKVKMVVKAKSYEFVTNGKVLKSKGWLSLYPHINSKDVVIPLYKKGDYIDVSSFDLAERETTPPKPYTVGTLASVMENVSRLIEEKEAKEILKEVEGIGTPATRAGIISELESGGYITQAKNIIRSTEKGKEAVQHLKSTGIEVLYSPLLTASWEKDLKSIENGSMKHTFFIEKIVDFVEQSSITIKGMSKGVVVKSTNSYPTSNNANVKTGTASGTALGKSKGRTKMGECGFCKSGEIVQGKGIYYCKNCKTKVWVNALKYRGVDEITEKEAQKILAKQKTEMKFTAKNSGSHYYGEVTLQGDGQLKVELVKKR